MKKKLVLGLLILALVFSAGCGQDNSATNSSSGEEQSKQELKIPDRKAELRGRVTDIIGNEVTIVKMGGISQENREKMQNLSQEERKALMQGSMNSEQTMETFIIPVGTPIATTQIINEERVLQLEDLTVIKKDTMLQVWMNEEGDIELITISSAGGGAGARGANQNGGGPPF